MIKVVLKLCTIFLKNGTNSKLFHLIKDGKDKILYIHIFMNNFCCPLTLCHTIPTLKDPQEKILWKKGNADNTGNQDFRLFQECFLLYHREKSSFQQCLIWRPASTDQSL